jgi:hypothetical protein
MPTIGCGISHKDTKHTDKCSNYENSTNKMMKPRTNTFQNIMEITQKKV